VPQGDDDADEWRQHRLDASRVKRGRDDGMAGAGEPRLFDLLRAERLHRPNRLQPRFDHREDVALTLAHLACRRLH
jgi:hypothetical protein